MRRRDFFALAVSTAVVSPWKTHAQSSPPLIGFLSAATEATNRETFASFKSGLRQTGLLEGVNYRLMVHWANRQADDLDHSAAEMIEAGCKVLVASGGNEAVFTALKTTKVTPIVFATGGDPIKLGFVKSISRPEGIITGATFYSEIEIKLVGLIIRYFPGMKRIYILHRVDPRSIQRVDALHRELAGLGIDHVFIPAETSLAVFAAIVKIDASIPSVLFPISDALFNSIRGDLAKLALGKRLALVGYTDEQSQAGALLAYGASRVELFRRVGVYAGRLFQGAAVSELPVVYSERLELSVNTSTAKALDIQFPSELLVLADRVYE